LQRFVFYLIYNLNLKSQLIIIRL